MAIGDIAKAIRKAGSLKKSIAESDIAEFADNFGKLARHQW
jgi:hypothetical protein